MMATQMGVLYSFSSCLDITTAASGWLYMPAAGHKADGTLSSVFGATAVRTGLRTFLCGEIWHRMPVSVKVRLYLASYQSICREPRERSESPACNSGSRTRLTESNLCTGAKRVIVSASLTFHQLRTTVTDHIVNPSCSVITLRPSASIILIVKSLLKRT